MTALGDVPCGTIARVEKGRAHMPLRLLFKLTRSLALLMATLLMATSAFAAEPVAVLHLVGIESMKLNEKAKMTVENGAMQLKAGKSTNEVKAASIEEIYTGTEGTQAGGRMGTAAKTGAIAAPYGTGAALSLILYTKVDMLTIVYRGSEGELHSALFAVPKGQAEQIKSQLLAAGAHAKEMK